MLSIHIGYPLVNKRSYWKWTFAVDLPIKSMVDLSIVMLVQRVRYTMVIHLGHRGYAAGEAKFVADRIRKMQHVGRMETAGKVGSRGRGKGAMGPIRPFANQRWLENPIPRE